MYAHAHTLMHAHTLSNAQEANKKGKSPEDIQAWEPRLGRWLMGHCCLRPGELGEPVIPHETNAAAQGLTTVGGAVKTLTEARAPSGPVSKRDAGRPCTRDSLTPSSAPRGSPPPPGAHLHMSACLGHPKSTGQAREAPRYLAEGKANLDRVHVSTALQEFPAKFAQM